MKVQMKARALTKQETLFLVTLIESSKIINSTCTNLAANKLKSEEWDRLTDQFNKSVSPNDHRTHQQLRVKWENLKRSANKRKDLIQENQSRLANGEEAEHIPPDDILDRVAVLLTGTIEGLTDHFGGDSENGVQLEPGFINEKVQSGTEWKTVQKESEFVPENNDDDSYEDGVAENGQLNDDGRRGRNLAIAEYYTAKSKLVDGIIQNMRLENEKLKLEISEYKKIRGEEKSLKLDDDDYGRIVRNLAKAEYQAAKSRLTNATFQNICLENDKLKLEISEYKKMTDKT